MEITSGTWRWRTAGTSDAPPDAGLEHVEMKASETSISAEGVAIGGGDSGWATRWRIVVDAEWASVRSLHLTRLGGPTVALRNDGYGEWSDGEGRRRPEFSGLSDCLVEGSPFGLIALLKRLGAKATKTQTIDVVAVSVPDFRIERAMVSLKSSDGGRRILLGRSDTIETIEVDADGIVTVWGDRIRRIGVPIEPEAIETAAE